MNDGALRGKKHGSPVWTKEHDRWAFRETRIYRKCPSRSTSHIAELVQAGSINPFVRLLSSHRRMGKCDTGAKICLKKSSFSRHPSVHIKYGKTSLVQSELINGLKKKYVPSAVPRKFSCLIFRCYLGLKLLFGINPLRESKILLEIFQYDSLLSGELFPGHVLDINPRPRFHPTCQVSIMKGKAG